MARGVAFDSKIVTAPVLTVRGPLVYQCGADAMGLLRGAPSFVVQYELAGELKALGF
jgi:hypothetical protein